MLGPRLLVVNNLLKSRMTVRTKGDKNGTAALPRSVRAGGRAGDPVRLRQPADAASQERSAPRQLGRRGVADLDGVLGGQLTGGGEAVGQLQCLVDGAHPEAELVLCDGEGRCDEEHVPAVQDVDIA